MKAIWSIVAGLGAMLILSFAMVFITMAHPPAPHKAIPHPRACKCMRKAGAP